MTRYAFRASDDFAAAVFARIVEMQRFEDEVKNPANDELAPHLPMYRQVGPFAPRSDFECVGFSDVLDQSVPPGLIRSRECSHLYPRNTRTGAPWRNVIERLSSGPKLSPVFSAHDVPAGVVNLDEGLVSQAGMAIEFRANQLHLLYGTWAGELVTKHLIPVPVSQFFLASERRTIEKRDGVRWTARSA